MRSLLGLTHMQVHRNDVAKPECSRKEAVTVASNLCYLTDLGDVSIALLIPCRSSLARQLTLY